MASERRHRWRRDAAPALAVPQHAPLVRMEVEGHQDPREALQGGEVPNKPRRPGRGRNSESFDPRTTMVRPDMRVLVGSRRQHYAKKLRHDDVVMVPEFFCTEEDWTMYYGLLAEIRKLQEEQVPNAGWLSWHEGCHLITKKPDGAPLFQKVVERMGAYFDVDPEGQQATRFNWYKDPSDWKPFHHDSAAFNEDRAQCQNITIGASFGTQRELAFHHAKHGTLTYFPQPNGCICSFGKDVNIRWRHGINAVAHVSQNETDDGSQPTCGGRISIVLWGRSRYAVDEEGSPPLLTEEMRGNAGYNSEQVCRDFLTGYCHQGGECKLRHL